LLVKGYSGINECPLKASMKMKGGCVWISRKLTSPSVTGTIAIQKLHLSTRTAQVAAWIIPFRLPSKNVYLSFRALRVIASLNTNFL
jgi:hypothetical protein